MKKVRIAILAVVFCLIFLLAACGKSSSGSDAIRRAIIKSPDGKIIDIRIERYVTYSHIAQIKSIDGTIYTVSYDNVLLIEKKGA